MFAPISQILEARINITNNTYLLILISSLKLLLLFRLVLEEEGINQKKENMMTTKNNHTFWRNHHYNGRCNHLGGPASFIKRAKLNYIFRLKILTYLEAWLNLAYLDCLIWSL